MVLGTGSHSAAGAPGAIDRRISAHAGVDTKTRSEARATTAAMMRVTVARSRCRAG